ncbi:SET domain [Dillenia turbinata]|uniref:SET domain n=1 Tax=Dillenia turbinata TaxID=194707 RepID=A0AAN8ZGA3_9MAGN
MGSSGNSTLVDNSPPEAPYLLPPSAANRLVGGDSLENAVIEPDLRMNFASKLVNGEHELVVQSLPEQHLRSGEITVTNGLTKCITVGGGNNVVCDSKEDVIIRENNCLHMPWNNVNMDKDVCITNKDGIKTELEDIDLSQLQMMGDVECDFSGLRLQDEEDDIDVCGVEVPCLGVGGFENGDSGNSLNSHMMSSHFMDEDGSCFVRKRQLAGGVTEVCEDGKDKEAVGMHLGEKKCSPNKGSSATLQSSESSGIVDNSNGIADGDVPKTDDDFGASNRTITVDCCGLTDKEGRDKGGFSCSLETRILQDMYLSPRGRTRMTKSRMQTQTTQVTRRCKKTVEKMSQASQTLQIFPMVTRRKRSCFYKPARSSIWGLLGTITQVFEHNNEDLNHVLQREKRSKSSKKRGKNSTCGNLQRSDGKFCSSTGHIRLKVKIGKQECKSNLAVFESANVGTLLPAPDFREPTVDMGTGSWVAKSAGCVEEDRTGKAASDLDVCALDPHITTKNFLVSASLSISAQNAQRSPLICSQKEIGEPVGGIDNRYLDVGTSPDSEVINLVPESQVGVKAREDLHDAVLRSPNEVADPADVTSLNMPQLINKKGKKNCGERKCGFKDELPGSTSSEKARLSGKRGHRKRAGTLSSEGSVPSNISRRSVVTESGISEDQEVLRVENGLLDDQNPKKPPYKSSKSRGRCNRSQGPNSGKSRRGNASRHKEKVQKSVGKSKAEESSPEQDTCIVAEHLKSGLGETVTSNEIASDGMSNMEGTLTTKVEHDLPQRSAWVRCDDCHKWRCISATLADSIEETNCKWTCKDNLDEAFADCSVSQEKSNAEINRELEISDASCDEDAYDTPLNYRGLECRNSAVSQPSQWMLIKSNLFLHRHRKTQTIDEIMVCHCKPPQDGRMGCGDECLNRMLNIECVQGTCPCGDLCSNQQFQKRNYAKLKWFRCGKKGYGLQLLEDISQGQFLIEYVGEVLDLHTYQARQRDYASKGHKHFYFMTLNGSEVIDACAKGNLGRFINHSCDPNCRTEKWMVNGEVCIGLFALRDIKKGEEVTFDYNYIRVFGAAVKKCVCGSPHCRGYIGGDPHNAEVIVQGDSDEEYPEPIMIHEDGEKIESIVDNNLMSSTVENQYPGISFKGDRMDDPIVADVPVKLLTKSEESVCKPVSTASQLQNSLEIEDETRKLPASVKPMELTLRKEDMRSNIESADQRISSEIDILGKSSDIQRFEGSLPCTTENVLCDSVSGNKKSVHNNVEEKPVFSKLLSIVKASRRSVKKAKAKSNHVGEKKSQTTYVKSQALSSKPKKLEISGSGRVDGVEEKLNELLNAEGGISKRKDAAKGYLKLLLLTAASGDSGNGEAIQSTRDLSMILDALLKTKSRMVLVDIINKNGLQMLHNIMKQNRKDFNKIPVLRKLLKVLEYLAGREVLTLDHIIAGPPCPGMESVGMRVLCLCQGLGVIQGVEGRRVLYLKLLLRLSICVTHFQLLTLAEEDATGLDSGKGSLTLQIRKTWLLGWLIRKLFLWVRKKLLCFRESMLLLTEHSDKQNCLNFIRKWCFEKSIAFSYERICGSFSQQIFSMALATYNFLLLKAKTWA